MARIPAARVIERQAYRDHARQHCQLPESQAEQHVFVRSQVTIDVIELLPAIGLDSDCYGYEISLTARCQPNVILADIAGMILHYIDDGITEAGLVPPHDLDRKTAWELQELFLFLDVVAHRKSPVLLEPQLHAVTRALP